MKIKIILFLLTIIWFSKSNAQTAATVKASIDAAITNKTAPNSIKPTDVGVKMKEVVDFVTNTTVSTSGSYANPSWITSLIWSKITGTPTTVAGYGILDAYTITQLQTSGQSSVHFDNLTNKPTTLTGYGITDAVILNGGNAFGSNISIGTSDAFGITFFTNGSSNSRYNISSSGGHTFTGITSITSTTTASTLNVTNTNAPSGSYVPWITMTNTVGNVQIGTNNSTARFQMRIDGTDRMNITSSSGNVNFAASGGSGSNIFNFILAAANAGGTSRGVLTSFSGTSSSAGYDATAVDVTDTEVFTAGNRNLINLLFNAVSQFAVDKRGKITLSSGSNKSTGSATLVAGTVTVANTSVTASSKIFFSVTSPSGTQGHFSYSKIAATSFTVTSTSATETSTFDWWIIN